MYSSKNILMMAAMLAAPQAALAADGAPPDRRDPSVAREQLEPPRPSAPRPVAPVPVAPREAQAPELAQAITVGAIRVEGATVVPASAFAEAIQPYLGRPLAGADLRALAGDVAGVLRKAGYGLATATVPQQRIENGILRVTVDEGHIDAVDAHGDKAVERVLAELANGKPVRTDKMERQLLLAEDLAGATLARPAVVRRNGRNVLTVEVYRESASGRVGVDNWGSNTVGPVRATLNIDMNAVLAADDRLSLGAAITPTEPGEFQYVEAGYTKAIGNNGTNAGVSGYLSHTRSGDGVDPHAYDGMSKEAEARLSHAIVRSRQFSGWVIGDLSFLDSALSRNGRPVRGDRIVSASMALSLLARGKGVWIRGRFGWVHGLDALGATDPGDPLASRRDASGRFDKFEFYSAMGIDIAPRLGLGLSIQGQIATDPLLVSEEFGLGGQAFVRAFDYREVSGDTGAAASAELRYDIPGLPRAIRATQLYVYADAGRVANLQNGFGGGSLASAGGGVRTWLASGFEGSLELGLPLTDSPFDADPAPRLSFTVSKSFSKKAK
jgi:hemolysin activation/secretion protein